MTTKMTTKVAAYVSLREGQWTFFSSCQDSSKNSSACRNQSWTFCIQSPMRGPFNDMAGQAGLEPATTGFGVRRSSQLELLTPVSPLDFYLAMQGMAPARRAEFF